MAGPINYGALDNVPLIANGSSSQSTRRSTSSTLNPRASSFIPAHRNGGSPGLREANAVRKPCVAKVDHAKMKQENQPRKQLAYAQQYQYVPGFYRMPFHDPTRRIPAHIHVQEIVNQLVRPTREMYAEDEKEVVLTVDWTMQTIGTSHFEYSPNELPRLQLDSVMRMSNQAAGLMLQIWDWLRHGGDELLLPAEYFSGGCHGGQG
ncbi:hypothetical protein K469DRAFT_167812 [Zopfia rhizophila CBS 207.26]|uniref:Uncharacterized protein n=1 Tax=Zopfia rhizophila CBS 207.26 TaxID=1314779 RepID=A0A6A6E517_9PEZI|nr:hypothetical protein K469DRAFT_167812 [Zopfia rhizophila CBS 207.26]